MMTTAQQASLIDLVCVDWQRDRRAHLDAVPRTATVGQIVSEAVRSMGLPLHDLYQAVMRGRELPQADTLEELGIQTDDQFELVPDVTAG